MGTDGDEVDLGPHRCEEEFPRGFHLISCDA
jgi:hypothetical protein